MDTYPFLKMHGLGNDFVILDARGDPGLPARAAAAAPRLADRRCGIGCDQVILRGPATGGVFMHILNADGSAAEACGNAARCVTALTLAETGEDRTIIETARGRFEAWRAGDLYAVDMGRASFDPAEIGLTGGAASDPLPLHRPPLENGLGVSVGNPHAVFFVEDVAAVPLAGIGPELETDPLFANRANIEIVQPMARDRLRMRVWERGVGITQACGSGACAVMAAAHRRGLVEDRAEILLDGGSLYLERRADGHLIMTGPVETVFEGRIALAPA